MGNREFSSAFEVDEAMDRVQRDIVEINNYLLDIKKLMRCVHEVSQAILAENRSISLKVSRMGTWLEDVETGI